MNNYEIETYELSRHWKQIEKYNFENKQDAIYTANSCFIETKDASYYKPRFVMMNWEDVVWYIFGSFNYSSSDIDHLCIFKDHRWKWLGKQLLDRFIEYIKLHNQKLVTLICMDENIEAQKFYKKYWFKQCWYNDYSSLIGWKWYKWLVFFKEI